MAHNVILEFIPFHYIILRYSPEHRIHELSIHPPYLHRQNLIFSVLLAYSCFARGTIQNVCFIGKYFSNCIPEYIYTNLLDKNHRRKVRIVNRQVCRELLCSMLCLRVGGRYTYKRGFLNLVTKYCHMGFSLLLSEMGLVFDIGYKGGSACECEKGSQKLPNLKI